MPRRFPPRGRFQDRGTPPHRERGRRQQDRSRRALSHASALSLLPAKAGSYEREYHDAGSYEREYHEAGSYEGNNVASAFRRKLFLVVPILGLCTRRDVVDLDLVLFGVAAPVFVVLVKTADRTFLDRTLRTALGVLARRLAFVLRRSVGTEVAIARTARCAAARIGTGRPPAWPRREASTAADGRSTWTRSAVAPRTRSAGRTVFARTCFADGERTSLEGLLIEPADRRLGDRAIGVIDKRESSRTAGFPINGENDLGGFADAGEMLA